LFFEEKARTPEKDNLTVYPGVLAAHPNSFWQVAEADLPLLVDVIRNLKSSADYDKLVERFAVRRTDPAFWQYSDALHDFYQQNAGVEYGVLDFNRFENR
jgi:hypothetical protein